MNAEKINHEESSLLSNEKNLESIEKFNYAHLESNIYYAKLHHLATKLGYLTEIDNDYPEKFCPCCGNSIEKKEFSLFCSIEQLKSSISFSYYIFLKLIKEMVKFLMLPYVFIVALPHLLLMALGENNDNIYIDRQYADLIFSIYFLVFVKIFLPFWLNKKLKIYYRTNKSISFVTILIRNLPDNWNKDVLKDLLEKRAHERLKKKVQVQKIISFKQCKKLREIQKKINKYSISQRKLKKMMFKKKVTQTSKNIVFFEMMEKKIIELQDKIDYLKDLGLRITRSTKETYAHYAFAVLDTSENKDELLKKSNFLICKNKFFYEKNFLILSSAPDANDIIVENLSRSTFWRFFFKYFIIAVAIGIMCAFYLIIYSFVEWSGLKIGNQRGSDDLNDLNHAFYRVLGSLFIMILNKIIEKLFLFLALFPKFETYTKLERFSLNLIGFFQFLNTFIMTFINYVFVEFIYNIFSTIIAGDLNSFKEIFDEFVRYFTTIFIFIMFIPIAHLFNISQLYKFYLRWKIKRTDITMEQKKLNKIFENVELEIINFYFDFNYIYFLSVFMWPFNPLWVFLSIGAFFILYWVFKFLLLRIFTIKKQKSEKTFFSLVNMIRKGPFLFNLGLFTLNIKFMLFFEESHKEDSRNIICTIIIFIFMCIEFLSNYVFFCNSKFFRGLSLRKNKVNFKEVERQMDSYHLFESIDFEGEDDWQNQYEPFQY